MFILNLLVTLLRFYSDCKKFKDIVEEIAEQQGKTEEKENEEASTAEAPASDDKKDAKD